MTKEHFIERMENVREAVSDALFEMLRVGCETLADGEEVSGAVEIWNNLNDAYEDVCAVLVKAKREGEASGNNETDNGKSV